jgi:hypothetical protein
MTDLEATLAVEAAKELVRALVAGLVELAGKIPALWRHAGPGEDDRQAAELARSAAELASADRAELEAARTRAEITWETHLRSLLASHPETRVELEGIVSEIRQHIPAAPHVVQNITSAGHKSTAQGAMFGNVINYGEFPAHSRHPQDEAVPGDGDRH